MASTRRSGKKVRIYLSWPSRVSFDFGKNQVTNVKCILFAHFFAIELLNAVTTNSHTDYRTQFLTKKKTKQSLLWYHNQKEAKTVLFFYY